MFIKGKEDNDSKFCGSYNEWFRGIEFWYLQENDWGSYGIKKFGSLELFSVIFWVFQLMFDFILSIQFLDSMGLFLFNEV